jgi:hypothetical protein
VDDLARENVALLLFVQKCDILSEDEDHEDH